MSEALRCFWLKGLTGDIIVAQGTSSWGLLSRPINEATKMVPIYLLRLHAFLGWQELE